MTVRLRLTDPDRELTIAADRVRFAPATRERIGVDVGDPVCVEAAESTVAAVGEDCAVLPEDAVLAGAAVERNAGADAGTPVTVEAAAAPAARTVSVAAESSSLDGDTAALSRALSGRYVTAGDSVEAHLFGGSVVVSMAVVDLDPAGPVEVTPETEISTRGDALDAAPRAAESAPSLSPIGGLTDERATLRRLVVGPLTDPEAYAGTGVRTPAGVLVHGPAGTGKTSLVRAVAADADLPLEEVPPEDCKRRESLAAALRAAAADAPAIVFIEDLAAAAPTPDSDGTRASPSAVGWLLDRVCDREDLVVVGEATHPEDVDPGLRRGGRFDAELRVGVPDRADRAEILRVHAAGSRLASDVDLDAVADRTHGYTGADLEAVLVDAATRAAHDHDRGRVTVRQGDVEAALDAVKPATLREVTVDRPEIEYGDIGGLDAAKRAVIRTVEWPLRYPELFDHLAVDAPTGILLSGPPGTGKTMLAKAVATSTSANFLAVDGPELMNRYVGESERGVREVFERARQIAPSVVFLDELDALAPARGRTDTGAAERVVSQLLTELDGLSSRGSVVVLAATNRPDSIDPALLRPGRIETRVTVPRPDRDERGAILSVHLEDVPTRGVDPDALAAETAGYTGSELAGVVREAALLAAEGHLRDRGFEIGDVDDVLIEQTHLRDALDRVEPSVDVDRP
ncbi:AAA family ATPase [Halobaculum rubrum]|uniref:AAA family ATPase n=1 Tax=Halobaculum rubrum TaxID=2872158 RepID=UPI001CA38863|nr:AAA family ATPase [Halobaculum rubrum]QZX99111.1 AAA family ATPase [Halobaculum rubrum]